MMGGDYLVGVQYSPVSEDLCWEGIPVDPDMNVSQRALLVDRKI
jgi:hypothetical protein